MGYAYIEAVLECSFSTISISYTSKTFKVPSMVPAQWWVKIQMLYNQFMYFYFHTHNAASYYYYYSVDEFNITLSIIFISMI